MSVRKVDYRSVLSHVFEKHIIQFNSVLLTQNQIITTVACKVNTLQ